MPLADPNASAVFVVEYTADGGLRSYQRTAAEGVSIVELTVRPDDHAVLLLSSANVDPIALRELDAAGKPLSMHGDLGAGAPGVDLVADSASGCAR